jgi:hypothetical protein
VGDNPGPTPKMSGFWSGLTMLLFPPAFLIVGLLCLPLPTRVRVALLRFGAMLQ